MIPIDTQDLIEMTGAEVEIENKRVMFQIMIGERDDEGVENTNNNMNLFNKLFF